jgi:membrane-associated phospholipid phosphatase
MSVSVSRHDQEPVTSRGDAVRLWPVVLGAIALLAALLAVLAVIVKNHPGPLPGDVGLELGVQHALLPHPALAGPLEAISTLNWPKPTAITMALIVVAFLLLRRWLDVIVAPAAAIVSSAATFELSRWAHRPRPSGHGIHPLQVITHTYSFPSGHVTYAVTVFGLFLFLTTQVRRPIHPALIAAIRAVLVALIVLMPVSRVLEGEHWPSDVLAGLLDGLIWVALFARAYLWARKRWPGLLAPDER